MPMYHRILYVVTLGLALVAFSKGQGPPQGHGGKAAGSPSNGSAPAMPPTHPLSVSIAFTQMPGLLALHFEETPVVQFNYTVQCDHQSTVYAVRVISTHPDVASIVQGAFFNVSCADADLSEHAHYSTETESSPNGVHDGTEVKVASSANETTQGDSAKGTVSGSVNVTFEARVLGRSFLLMVAKKISGPAEPKGPAAHQSITAGSNATGNDLASVKATMPAGAARRGPGRPRGPGGAAMPVPPNTVLQALILVIKLPTIYDEMFRITSYVVIVIATTGMGIKVDLKIIKAVLKKPLAPGIGLFSQYVCMPLIAYAVAKLVPQPSPAVALGIFACGIVPGGGASNIYCYLLGGDISLSVTMTTISSIAAFGLLPFWLYTLGETFQDEMSTMHVPFLKILETLAVIILPIFVGIFIRHKSPKLAKLISKILKPVLLVVVIFFLTVGIYLHLYIFKMIRPMQILAGCLLPYIGYLIGGLIALIFRQSWTHIKTIAIETGIQNVGIAFLILFLSLPPPDNLLSIVGPAASGIMTPLPLLLITIVYTIYNRCNKKDYGNCENEDGHDEGDEKHFEGQNGVASKGKKKGGLKDKFIGRLKYSKPSEADQEMLSKEKESTDDNTKKRGITSN